MIEYVMTDAKRKELRKKYGATDKTDSNIAVVESKDIKKAKATTQEKKDA